jgi:hypothetical protein
MSLVSYNTSWVGIDGGREGLWKEPLWTDVLRIISTHSNEGVYEKESPIYKDLEKSFPNEAWRSQTAEGAFRPLFRDYPNSWTRTGVVSLSGKRFNVTELGLNVLSGHVSKTDILVSMFKMHKEILSGTVDYEKPFSILASAFLETNRLIKTEEVYWAVMKNYRPGVDNIAEIIKKKIPMINKEPDSTPYRRMRNMLSLMRASNAIESTRRGSGTFWSALDNALLHKISENY